MIRELRKVAPVDQGPRTGPDATKAAGNEMVGCHDDASVCRTGLRQDVKHPCSAGAGGYANTICRVPENPNTPSPWSCDSARDTVSRLSTRNRRYRDGTSAAPSCRRRRGGGPSRAGRSRRAPSRSCVRAAAYDFPHAAAPALMPQSLRATWTLLFAACLRLLRFSSRTGPPAASTQRDHVQRAL
jgi:hypothetical protein